MANANRVDIGKGTEKLVHVQFDLKHGHGLLEFGVMATSAVNGLGYIFQHEVQVNFIFLWDKVIQDISSIYRLKTHFVSVRIKKCAKVNDVWMGDESHYLEFPILLDWVRGAEEEPQNEP